MSSDLQRLQHFFNAAVARAQRDRELPAALGRKPGVTEASNFTVPGKPGFTWVRVNAGDGTTIVPAINHVVANKPDIPVWVAENESGVYEVLRIRGADFLKFSGGVTLPNTSAAPTSSAPTTARKLVPGLVAYDSGLTVSIQPFSYRYGTQAAYYPGGTLNLTSYVPTTSNQHVWCKVGVNPATNTAVAVVGTAKVVTVQLLDSELAALDFGLYIPLAGVRLKYGDTSLASAARFTDCRPWWTVQAEPLSVSTAKTLTLSSGAVTVTQTAHILAAESGTTDDLDTLTVAGDYSLVLLKATASHTITVKHGTGNISLNGAADFELSGDKTLLLFYDGTSWADTGAGGGSGGATTLDGLTDVDTTTTPPTDGQALLYDNASSQWLPGTVSGGGAGANEEIYTRFDPDAPPSSASVYDDEFDDSSLDTSKWTEWDYASEGTVSEGAHGLKLVHDTSTTTWSGIYQDKPGYSTWTMYAKLNRFILNTGYSRAGIAIFEDATNSTGFFKTLFSLTRPEACRVTFQNWTAYNGGASTVDEYTINLSPGTYYLRFRYDGTNLHADQSYDGLGWQWIGSTSLSSASFAHIGLVISGSNSDPDETAYFEFFRVVEGAGFDQWIPGRDVPQGGTTCDTLALDTGNVSNPPTDAELDGLFGTPATVGAGFTRLIDDNGADSAVYLVASNGTSWWYTAMTKAT